MKRTLNIFAIAGSTILIVGMAAASAVSPPLPQESETGGWVELFDGQSLKGWVQRGGKAEYRVETGEIVGQTVPHTPNSFLCTERNYGDFVLELQFKIDPRLNSGVQVRSQSTPEYKNGQVHGYQVEIDPSDRAWTAGIYDEGRRGWLNDLATNRRARYAFRPGEWNQLRIEARGDRIRTWLNGVPAADLRDDMTPTGFVALQVHGVGEIADPLEVRFRHIRMQDPPQWSPESATPPVPPQPIFASDADWQIVADGLRFSEGPALGPDRRLYFSDIPNNRILVYDPNSANLETQREPSGMANGLGFTPAGALIACESGERALTRIAGAERKVLADQFEGRRLNSPNDVALDGVGGIYFTDPRYGNRDSMELDFEGMYYVTAQGQLRLMDRDLIRPNGLAVTPDGRRLYVADHGGAAIWLYDVVRPGELANKRKIADIGSDGMTLDRWGRLFVTWKDEVVVLSPEGERLEARRLPQSPTNCVLAGSTLYVTTPTAVYSIATRTEGLD